MVFELLGWKCGNFDSVTTITSAKTRAPPRLLSADIIFMPACNRMCTPGSIESPGAGFVDPKLWKTAMRDPTSLR